MNLNDHLKLEQTGMTQNELDRLRSHLADRIASQMSYEDLVQFVFDDYCGYFDKLPDNEFLDEARTTGKMTLKMSYQKSKEKINQLWSGINGLH